MCKIFSFSHFRHIHQENTSDISYLMFLCKIFIHAHLFKSLCRENFGALCSSSCLLSHFSHRLFSSIFWWRSCQTTTIWRKLLKQAMLLAKVILYLLKCREYQCLTRSCWKKAWMYIVMYLPCFCSSITDIFYSDLQQKIKLLIFILLCRCTFCFLRLTYKVHKLY